MDVMSGKNITITKMTGESVRISKMKALTENQQCIIDAITSEFSRINGLSATSGSFNLVDASGLMSINDEIKRNKEETDAINHHWYQLAMDEALRVAELLQQDLPMACVERFGKSNGKYECPSVIIQRKSGRCGHHENYVSFDVKIVYGDYVRQSHGCGYNKPIGLRYEYSGKSYDSVEDLFKNSQITKEIRIKILK